MRNKTIPILLLLILAGALFFSRAHNRILQKHIYLSGWVSSIDFAESSASFKGNVSYFSEVNPFIYAFNNDGAVIKAKGFTLREYKELISVARKNNVRVIPTVVNDVFESNGGPGNILKDSKLLHSLLGEDISIQKHIEDIFVAVALEEADGIEIDYEGLGSEDRNGFIKFIKLLSEKLHGRSKLLNVVLPAGDFYGARTSFSKQQLRLIGDYADSVKIMCYNLHGPFNGPGPLSTPRWIEKILKEALANIPREKISIAIALQGFEWSQDKVNRLTYRKIMQLIEKYRPYLRRSSDGVPYFVYYRDGKKCSVWFEDAKSLIRKINAVRMAGINKIAFWRIGGEDQNLYSKLAVIFPLRYEGVLPVPPSTTKSKSLASE